MLLHALCHGAAEAANEYHHDSPVFQQLLGELATRGETWAAKELREYATKGTPEEQGHP